MKVLAINGSPKGEAGKTWWVLEKFIKGMEEAGAQVTAVQLAHKKIHHCTGELACWLKTPGECIHDDDMAGIIELYNDAEAFVLATPVYVDGMTGLMKNCIDRMVSTAQPFFEVREGHMRHPPRGSKLKRVALVSTCGFPELDNFDPLVHHVKAICKNMNAEFAGSVLRPGAPALDAAAKLHPFKTRDVSKAIRKAGEEFIRYGKFSDETLNTISMEIFSPEDYKREANKAFEKVLKKLEEKNK